ncbi:hypothetical protein HOD29_03440 [archaeon]|jgi:hypothetical protein|nr:hypothetical protein [archaeon]
MVEEKKEKKIIFESAADKFKRENPDKVTKINLGDYYKKQEERNIWLKENSKELSDLVQYVPF